MVLNWLGLAVGSVSHLIQAQESPRVTPAVKVIESVRSAILPIFTQSKEGVDGAGTGALIHPSKFILTADQVTQNHLGLVMFEPHQDSPTYQLPAAKYGPIFDTSRRTPPQFLVRPVLLPCFPCV